ncbi:P-type conjugative transfer protein TrbL [Rubrivirga sp. S365]|uniref:P-type conjugative transfer protein TrbL n=1 Tax=Rubrivirga sp. S365 TaxID=3076080 RepID=UPI0028C77A75|nr:P-type conjugative transfer protein TrbL [Rubrivirga sp. S365]MDT7858198.1 P-type conjugative transfer protein TrbL [Rubrivirga sp. S365]
MTRPLRLPPPSALALGALAVAVAVALVPEAAAQTPPPISLPPVTVPPGTPGPTLPALPPIPPLGPPPPFLDTIVEDFRTAVEAARPALIAIATGTFGVLALIEIAMSGIIWTFKKEAWSDVLGSLVLKLAWMGFAFSLLASFSVWFPPIIEGFQAAGQAVAPGTVSPTDILGLGITLSGSLLQSFFEGVGLLDFSFSMLGTAVFVGLACTLIVVSFALVAAHVVVVLVESFIALAAGALVLGFAAFRGTASLADRFVAYVFNLGIRVFSLFLVVGIGQRVVEGWVPYVLNAADDLSAMLAVLGGAVTFALLAFVVPIKVSSLLTRDLAVGFEKALSNA